MASIKSATQTPSVHIALDIGFHEVRAIEMARSRNPADCQITRRGTAPLDAAFWTNSGGNRSYLVAALQSALQNAGITGKQVAACLPRRLATVRILQVPPAPPEELRGMLAFEAQQLLPYPVEEVVLSSHMHTQIGADGMAPVMLAAVRRELVQDVLAAFTQAGLQLARLSLSSLALAELLPVSSAPQALFCVNEEALDVAVTREGETLFTRASTLSSAENFAGALAREADRTITAYQNEQRGSQVEKLWITGPVLARPGETLSQLQGMLEKEVNLLQEGCLSPSDPGLAAYATAIGMCLNAGAQSRCSLNLIPEDHVSQRQKAARSRRNAIFALLGVVVLSALIMQVQNYLHEQSIQEQNTIDANKKWRELQPRLKQRQTEEAAVQSLADALNNGLQPGHPVVNVLTAISKAMPTTNKIWLEGLTFQRGRQITLRGSASDPQLVTTLLLSLQSSHIMHNSRLTFLGDVRETMPAAVSLGSLPPLPPPPPAFQFPAGQNQGAFPHFQGKFPPGGFHFPPGAPPQMAANPAASPLPAGAHVILPGGPPHPGAAPPSAPAQPAKTAGASSVITRMVTGFVITCQLAKETASNAH